MITLKRLTRGAFFMEYQKKYRNPKNESEDLIVSWERGYREVQIHYRDQLVGVVSGIRDLLKGKAFTDPSLGSVEVKLEEDPYFIQLIVDGYHSPDNLHYPVNDLKNLRSYFIPSLLFNGIATLINLILYFTVQIISLENTIFLFYFLIPFVLTIVGNIILSTKHWYGFLINFISGLLQFLLPLSFFVLSGDPVLLTLSIIFSIQAILMLIPVKRAYRAFTHDRLRKRTNQETIDL
jgi:hypothetical protein